jgi:hypothetical protein
MTAALTVYSATFMRYALAVSPKNYLLFACHFINCSAQMTQGYRYLSYWKYVLYPSSSTLLPLVPSSFLHTITESVTDSPSQL